MDWRRGRDPIRFHPPGSCARHPEMTVDLVTDGKLVDIVATATGFDAGGVVDKHSSYEAARLRAQFVLYPGVGHSVTPEMRAATEALFRAALRDLP